MTTRPKTDTRPGRPPLARLEYASPASRVGTQPAEWFAIFYRDCASYLPSMTSCGGDRPVWAFLSRTQAERHLARLLSDRPDFKAGSFEVVPLSHIGATRLGV